MWKCGSTKGGATRPPAASIVAAGLGVETRRDRGDRLARRCRCRRSRAVGQRAALDDRGRSSSFAFPIGVHQRLRDRRRGAPPAPAPGSTARRAASGRPGRARRRRTLLQAQLQASKAANSSAPSSALPGRQEPNTTSATQIQPRPLTMLKKKALKADSVRKAPPTPSARCRRRPRRCACAVTSMPWPRPPPGSRRPCAPPGRAACGRAPRRRAAPRRRRDRSAASGEQRLAEHRNRRQAGDRPAARTARSSAAWSPREAAAR